MKEPKQKKLRAPKVPKVAESGPLEVTEIFQVQETEVQSTEEPKASSEPEPMTYEQAYGQVRALKNTSALNMFHSFRRRMSDQDALTEVLRKMGMQV